MCSDKVFVSVKPFLHQVGGHMCMFQITPGIVCKPKRDVEVAFYRSLPVVLKPYVPQYYGLTDLRCDNKDDILFYAEVPRLILSNPCMKNIQLITLNGEDEILKVVEKDGHNIAENIGIGLNKVCNEHVYRHHFTRYGYWADRHTSYSFTMLENLLESYHLPNIMDIKMGTKQYVGLDNPDRQNKMKRFDEVCSISTSSKIGFRLSGFQVYKQDIKEYITKDKYQGQVLDVHGVHCELKTFLHDGFNLRSAVIKNIIQKIENLHDVLIKLDSYHFFCCSLLLFYDSAASETYKNGCADEKFQRNKSNSERRDPGYSYGSSSGDMKLIDFGRAYKKSDCHDLDYGSGVLFGLKNLSEILKSIVNEQ